MEVTKNLMVTVTKLQYCSVESLPVGPISAALLQSVLHSRVARWKPLLSNTSRHMTACLELAKKQLEDSQNMRNKILWSDETKTELFADLHTGLNLVEHLWRDLNMHVTVHQCSTSNQSSVQRDLLPYTLTHNLCSNMVLVMQRLWLSHKSNKRV